MAFDYFTIRAFATELHDSLSGRRVAEARSAPSDGVSGASCLAISAGDGQHLIAEFGHTPVLCWLAGRIPEVCSRSDGMERYVRGAVVEAVTPDERDRIIRLRLSRSDEAEQTTYGILCFELIEPRPLAVLTSERSGKIIYCWRESPAPTAAERQLRVGEVYSTPPGRRLLPAADSADFFARRVEACRPTDLVERILRRCLAAADAAVTERVLAEAAIPQETRIVDLAEKDVRRLWESATALYSQPCGPQAYFWTSRGRPMFSALQPLPPRVDGDSLVELPTVSAAIARWRQAQVQVRTGVRHVKRALKTVRRSIEAVERDLERAAQAEEYERKGSILLSQISVVPAGAERIELADTFQGEDGDYATQSTVWIELDRRLSATDNAARYLKAAAKMRRRAKLLPARLRDLRERERRLLDGTRPTDGDPRNSHEEPSARRKGGKTQLRMAGPAAARPRRYRTRSGWIVWAGRNNKENDELTHRMAAAEDIWFHASGYSGSHVVLRREGRRDEPSRDTLLDAASVAAYWSRGRSSGMVPVVYTLVKHVSKPKGSPPGLALPRCVQSIVVKPSLLPEQDEISKEVQSQCP